jgi:DNA topoisomerase-2
MSAVEQVYQKKTPLEHILLRPDTYVGSTEAARGPVWLASGEGAFYREEVEVVPALYKIFDEVLVNAADNYQRDPSMSSLAVGLDPEAGWVEVRNDGRGIPVVLHREYNLYVPELVFGHLLTGSNYNDSEKKVVGGRNGYGAKLANIFSKEFELEVGDAAQKLAFQMTWTKNMSQHSLARITPYKGKDFVRVRFHPDFALFKLAGFTPSTVDLFRRRVYDMAGLFGSRVRVSFNQQLLRIGCFEDYVKLYLREEAPRVHDREAATDRWEVVVSYSDGEFQQVSFVNGISTTRGGTHVQYISDQIVARVQEAVTKKSKDLAVKPHQIRQHLWIFVRALVENPAFDSQTKETLVTKPGQFGSLPVISEKMVRAILKSGIIDQIIHEAKAREMNRMSRATAGGKKARLTGVPKLDDANDAGTRHSERCVLILTEGDSAKALAVAGIEVVGRDCYGVFPLKGKLLNVREASPKQVLENQEIQNIIKIMGLQVGRAYEDVKSLRYGALMIMTDQDTDGSHIKGLIINLIHQFWPSLLRLPGFLLEFITPIQKAIKGSQELAFYSAQDYQRWAEAHDTAGWRVKYYKGLGTSTDREAKEYFSALEQHRLHFVYQDREDDEAIELVFSRKKANERKAWLEGYDPRRAVDVRVKALRIRDFVNDELIHFSIADNLRSIPSLVDGLKPGQRKIVFACFKRNLRQEIKVAQLSGYVAEHSAYHHGEMSLAETIVGMAQNFVGANNLHLLEPIGQFGSRNQGGKEHASPRYIFTNLSSVARALFPEPDDHTLEYQEDDGQQVEPTWYVPVLPLVLVNGAEGIGTGWSTSIPCYRPADLAAWVLARLQDQPLPRLVPWYYGFTGQILENGAAGYFCNGVVRAREDDPSVLDVTELPVKKWTKDYKLFLDKLTEGEQAPLAEVREYHTKNRVHFELHLSEEGLKWGEAAPRHLKLQGTIPTTNFVLFDTRNRLRRYSGPEEIMHEFFGLRLAYYERRKDYLLSRLARDLQVLDNKQRFIREVIEETVVIRKAKKAQLC